MKKGRSILRWNALETVSYSGPASPPNLLVRVPAEALALSFNPAAGASCSATQVFHRTRFLLRLLHPLPIAPQNFKALLRISEEGAFTVSFRAFR